MPRPTEQEWREGCQRLVAWLPQAMEEAMENIGKLEAMSSQTKAAFASVTMDNLEAVMIYPAPKGGWHADITMKDVPPGVMNSMGTPVENPCPTREAAEEMGHMILASVVALIQAGTEAAPPIFMLYGYAFPLVPELMVVGTKVAPDGYGSEMRAIVRINEVLEELRPDGVTADTFEDFKDWSLDDKASLLSVIHTAALSGIFRYPQRKHGAPE